MDVNTQRRIAFGLDSVGLYDRPQRFVVVGLSVYLGLLWLKPQALWDPKTGVQRRMCALQTGPSPKDQPLCTMASAEVIAVVLGLISVLAF